jgi:hypothetical protein
MGVVYSMNAVVSAVFPTLIIAAMTGWLMYKNA